ncbi:MULTISPECIES: hypothetical protein [Methanothrix]|jgi:hypothetical protein|uniref:Uncharacterized protein n=1 Tax=Methanothrix soehngenii (strain ATCC 5969 / DSM 3671 / JCM 10134 / NBRC 103675 / OCM 69 / GP-6) TaxID=990316 RepID=F4BZC2_METSG|nr:MULTISPECIES: hypothetical protein [Methanothrix]AEB68992.1 hypothetical protein MCON_2571 [Methanothrix soehngenii GP6]UEC39680.1 MAG: hypothetical protein METHSR3v1_550016 [Methanothrix sp.]HNQ52411.1 hypothetical protein [Methanothrix soehngenii]HOI20268.1 hypothetical protein [Methanothrix soehngenii]HPY92330.1 hypothetical protein [Methanothrix soehngenii]
MLDEFARYTALQRDQMPLAMLLVYLKRKGGFVQLNQIWRELGPTGGGPFWNQTTLINKLDKLERLGVVVMEKRILPSPRAEAKKKTNTFYRLSPATPLYPYVYGMLKIYKEEQDRYSSQLVDKPLDHLCRLAGRSSASDPLIGRELEVAKELISEVFSVGGDEVRMMIKERMVRKGMIRDRRRASPEEKTEEKAKAEKKEGGKVQVGKAKRPTRRKRKEAPGQKESE